MNSHENQDIIGGYFLDGFHNNGDSATKVDGEKVCTVVKRCLELLPQNKLKVMLGAYNPALIVQLVHLGIDLFDTTYAYLAALENRALTFNFDVNREITIEDAFSIDLSDNV